ncbi:MAG: protein kinase [Proteobacteria bacterium]|nr:protein kinase [Pseudomonadota bacterium]
MLDIFRGTQRFEIIRELGVGGMGTVYEARDREQNQRVALKFLQQMDAKAILRFKGEYRVARDIHHRNLVRLGDLFKEEGRWFFTMELISGVDIVKYVRPAVGSFDEDRLRSALGQLAAGLLALHRADQVHRDIKPSNVLVTGEGRIVLLDFGMTTALDAPGELSSGSIMGTSQYMAPEQAMGETVTTSADWYSVGVLLYQLLTGEVPFKGDHVEISLSKYRGDPPRPRDRIAGIPDDLDELCTALLSRDPASRASGDDVARVSDGKAGKPAAPLCRNSAAHSLPGRPADRIAGRDGRGGSAAEASDSANPGRSETSPAGLAARGERSSPERSPDNAIDRAAGRPAVSPASHCSPGRLPDHSVLFVDRKAEMDLLEEAFTASRAEPMTVCIHGPSGIGKTTLVEQLRLRIRDRHDEALFLLSRCYPRESVPYKAVDAAIDTLTHWLADRSQDEIADLLPDDVSILSRMFPVLRRVHAIARAARPIVDQTSPRQLRARALSVLAELIRRIAARRPLVLVIDDIQWADGDSRSLLEALLAPLDPPCILIVTTERQPAGVERLSPGRLSSGSLPASWLPGRVREVELGPLPADAATQLARALLSRTGMSAAARADAVADSAGGHPGFIEELVAVGAEQGGDPEKALSLSALFERRIAALDARARRILDILCAAGPPLNQDACAAAAKLAFSDFVDLGRDLVDTRLARMNGSRRADTIELYHDEIRAILAREFDRDAMRAANADIALALEMTDCDTPERLADHWIAAGNRRKGREYCLAAAERASNQGAMRRAVDLYEKALECGQGRHSDDGDDGAEKDGSAALRLADSLIAIGHCARAGEVLVDAAAARPVGEVATVKARAAEQFLRGGYVERGLELLSSGAAALDLPSFGRNASPRLTWQRALARLFGLSFRERRADEIRPRDLARIDFLAGAALGLMGIEHGLCAAAQTEHFRHAMRVGELSRVQRAVAFELIVEAMSGSARRRGQLSDMLDDLTERCDTPTARSVALLSKGLTSFHSGRFKASCDDLARCRRNLDEIGAGASKERSLAAVYQLRAHVYMGDFSAAHALFGPALASARERGDRYGTRSLPLGQTVLLWLAHNDSDRAAEQVDGQTADADIDRLSIPRYEAVLARSAIELYRGRSDLVLELLRISEADLRRSRVIEQRSMRIQIVDITGRAYLATAAATHNRRDRAEYLSQAMEQSRLLARERVPWATAMATAIRVSAATIAGGGMPSDWQRAAQEFESAHMMQHRDVCRWRQGLLTAGDDGGELASAALRAMQKRGVVAPARFASVLVPGPSLSDA